MDSRRNKEKRRTATIPTRKKGGEGTSVKVKESRALEKPYYAEKSASCSDVKENAPQVKKIFEPVKHQIQLILEYINILELRKDLDPTQEIMILAEFISNISRQCAAYLNAQFIKLGNGHG